MRSVKHGRPRQLVGSECRRKAYMLVPQLLPEQSAVPKAKQYSVPSADVVESTSVTRYGVLPGDLAHPPNG